MVSLPDTAGRVLTDHSPCHSSSPFPGEWEDPSPHLRILHLKAWLVNGSQAWKWLFTASKKNVTTQQKRVCTLHLQKWTRFACWYDVKHIEPATSLLPDILACILELKSSGLLLSSTRVHLAAIRAFHFPVEGYSACPVTMRFLKGLCNLFLPVKCPTSVWDISLVLK